MRAGEARRTIERTSARRWLTSLCVSSLKNPITLGVKGSSFMNFSTSICHRVVKKGKQHHGGVGLRLSVIAIGYRLSLQKQEGTTARVDVRSDCRLLLPL